MVVTLINIVPEPSFLETFLTSVDYEYEFDCDYVFLETYRFDYKYEFDYDYDFLETFRFDHEYEFDYNYDFLETLRFDYVSTNLTRSTTS